MSCAQLASQLTDVRTYEVEFDSKKYQVEVQILENDDSYVHVGVAVDDGHFWRDGAPFRPALFAERMAQSDDWREIAISLIVKQ